MRSAAAAGRALWCDRGAEPPRYNGTALRDELRGGSSKGPGSRDTGRRNVAVSSAIDTLVLVVYVAAVVVLGCWLGRRSRTTHEFMAAGGRLPAWAVGLSLFGTFLSSNTFIGNPGKAYDENWSFFVFSLTLPFGAWVAARWFVPLYRNSGEISAYHHLERRFGPWARIYAVVCYLLTQVARTGTILLGVSLGMHAVTGWDIRWIIVVTGVLVTFYTLVGGIEAVIWTDVMQSLVLSAGAVLVVITLLAGEPAAPELFRTAVAYDKFSLGSFALDVSQRTFWVVFAYGFFINLTNFGIDQNYIQRYHTARSIAAARRSLWFGALTYIPVSAVFFLIGTLLFAYYEAHPEQRQQVVALAREAGRPEAVGDFALPHYMASNLPVGVGGLLVAALFAAAMSTIDTSLNSSATITLRDICRPIAVHGSERAKMAVLRGATVFWGVVGTVVAVALSYDDRNLLRIWWDLSGVFAGAMLGLFLLGVISRRATSPIAAISVTVGVLVIAWISFSQAPWMPPPLRAPFSSLMTTVVGTLTILLVGILLATVRDWLGSPAGSASGR